MLSFFSWLTWAFVPTGLLTLILIAGGLRSVEDVLLARVDDFLLEHALFLHRAVVDDGLGRRQVRLLDAIGALFQVGLVPALFMAIIGELFFLYLLAPAWLFDLWCHKHEFILQVWELLCALFSIVDKAADSFNERLQLVPLARQVVLKSFEAIDHVIVLFVLALLLVFVSIQHAELLHELSLDLLLVRSFLVLFLPVDGDEIGQLR